MSKNETKFSALETGGKYSSRKIPRWHLGHNDLMEYVENIRDDWNDGQTGLSHQPA